jgi:fused signal recognition particle receptor
MGLFDRAAVDDEVWDELEELLISADVGVSTTGKLIERVQQRAREEKLKSGSHVREALKSEMVAMLDLPVQDSGAGDAVPSIVLVVGVNGSGKTTSIAKLAYSLKKQGRGVILAAADTFRAAAIDQLEKWGERIGIDVIAHQHGADPGAVVYDTLQAARSRQADVVVIDTAGRLHTRYNLMEELKKIKRVAARNDPSAPHEVILVLDATTGQNGLMQAREFTGSVGVTGIFLAKLDGTARGGVVLSIADQLRIPIKYVGTGENIEDMAFFDAAAFVEALCE